MDHGWADEVFAEFRESAVVLVFEQVEGHASQWEAICPVAAKLNVSGEAVRKWVRQAEVDAGARRARRVRSLPNCVELTKS